MSTAVLQPAPAAKAAPLSDSLMSMIDEAHAEPAKADSATEAGTVTPIVSTPSDNTPPNGKAVAGNADISAESEKKQETEAAATAKSGADESKDKPNQADMFKKRLNEQTAVNSRLGRELKEANSRIKILEQQIAGTYQAPAEPTADEKAKLDEFRGKETASRRMASEKYGEPFVMSQIYDDGAPYQQLLETEPWHHIRVARADHPVEEALRVLREKKVYEELGPDPDRWEQAIIDKVRPDIMKEFQKQHADASTIVGKQAKSVGDGRGAAEGREPVKVDEEFSLSALGGHFLD